MVHGSLRDTRYLPECFNGRLYGSYRLTSLVYNNKTFFSYQILENPEHYALKGKSHSFKVCSKFLIAVQSKTKSIDLINRKQFKVCKCVHIIYAIDVTPTTAS